MSTTVDSLESGAVSSLRVVVMEGDAPNGTSIWTILPISRVSTVEISRPQPCLALQYCCDPEYTMELECQYSCPSASWTDTPITPGPERCSVCYPATPSQPAGMDLGA